ncbi:hypothetical protein DSO57_1001126 [Entomophthora muscae]|uniref:Uncharacterized protein n=1 Tax=Entomophthora muscae TaxID=34485 RepID=A0ACC2S052_9FUNG|nr:hypothetical protein DSO57_1001126 [Entomophthora muscae]
MRTSRSTNIDELEVCGYSIQHLLDIIGRVLLPCLIVRLKQLMMAHMQPSSPEEEPMPDLSYQAHLRLQNFFGFFEGGLLICLAANGETGEGAPWDLQSTLSRTFLRVVSLTRQTRNSEIHIDLKRTILAYSAGHCQLPFSCLQYRYGRSFSQAIHFSLQEKRPLKSLKNSTTTTPMLGLAETLSLS